MSDTQADGWEQTLTEMRALAAERADEGWETVTVQAGDTAPVPPEAGDDDRFGFVYTVPDDAAEAIESAVDAGAFDEYTVYRRTAGGTRFQVVELADPDAGIALYVAGAVAEEDLADLREAAREAGAVYTHLQLLDWTRLGSFRHDDPAAFFPALE